MTWDDTLLLVITSGITSELKNFSSKIFEHGSQVNWIKYQTCIATNHRLPRTRRASTNALSVVAPLQETVNTTDGELETSLG